MVRSAVGADSTRGDQVSVVSVPFAPAIVVAPEVPKTDLVRVVQTAQRPLLGVLGLAMIIVVVLLSLKSLKPAGASTGAIAGSQQMMALPAGSNGVVPQAIAPATLIPVVLPTNTMRDKVNSTIEQQPDVAARVVRAWLKEG